MKRVLPIVVALVPLLLSGCIAVVAASAAGVGLVKHQKNETSRNFPQGVEETWLAALQAMEQLGYGQPAEAELAPLEAQAEFADASDTIRLRFEGHSEGGTRLIVRVGRFDTKSHRRKAAVIVEETSSILQCDDELRAWTQKVQGLDEAADEDPPH